MGPVLSIDRFRHVRRSSLSPAVELAGFIEAAILIHINGRSSAGG
jgi:hypothetical protein